MKEFYKILIDGIPEGLTVTATVQGLAWTGAELSDGSFGIAMHTEGSSVDRIFPTLVGLDAKKAAEAVMSWNMEEASEGMAVINAFYNSEKKMRELDCEAAYERVCTAGYETEGRTFGFIGHLTMPEATTAGASKVYIMERRDIKGDYPDAACEYILPECDFVLITGSASINKTMPRLLELSEKAVTILVGPTVPMCPALIGHGIDRLSGMVVKDKEQFKKWMTEASGNPYPYGYTFMI